MTAPTHLRRSRRHAGLPSLLAAAALVLAGCSGGTSVGGDGLTEGLGDAVDLERLGEASEQPIIEASPSAAPSPTPDASPTDQDSPTPTATPSPSPSVAASAAVVVSIHPDGGAEPQFSPRIAEVPAGSIVTWTNRDQVERSVVADNGSFASPPLAPGESWSLTFDQPGRYDYHDGTRLYVLGTVEVTP